MVLTDEERKAKAKAYKQTPEYKAQAKKQGKEYRERPEVKAKEKARKQTPEHKAKEKISRKEYNSRPEVKARKKAYKQTPEYKAQAKKYGKEYMSLPEVKARNKEVRDMPENLVNAKNQRDDRRLNILQHYSKRHSNSNIPCCRCCGENYHIDFLEIDHIAGKKQMDLEPELKKLNYSSKLRNQNLHRWIIKNNFPDGFQILCTNCNFAKGMKKNNNKCPHEMK